VKGKVGEKNEQNLRGGNVHTVIPVRHEFSFIIQFYALAIPFMGHQCSGVHWQYLEISSKEVFQWTALFRDIR
jgi:hypothetical protein